MSKCRKAPARHVVQAQSTAHRVVEKNRGRLLTLVFVFALSFCIIGVRLVELMIDGYVVRMAQADTQEDVTSLASHATKSDIRADIVDRNGVVLATNVMTASLSANPKVVHDPGKVARALVRIFPDLSYNTLRARLKRNQHFVWIKRHLTPTQQERVNRLGIPGLYFVDDVRRVYPHGHLFAHVLGYVNIDNRGLAGVERTFDARLKDTWGAQPVALSLDVRLQHIVHNELRKGMREFKAIGATGIVADIASGEVMAMVSLPDFDPHTPEGASEQQRFNRATLGAYELGSTFKTFTVAMALEYGTASLRDSYDATQPIKVARYTIRDSHPKRRWLSVPEIFAYSSNIGTVRMVQEVGMQRQQAFLRSLGLFEPLSVELPARARPIVPQQWKDVHMMTISFGHGMAVSPLHLVRSTAALVGDGRLRDMTLLRGGNVRKALAAPIVRENTVHGVRRLLRLVVERGTARKGNVPGYRVGGKTGTAEKVKNGRYSKDAKMSMFVSAFPMDNPKYVLLVILDEPKGTRKTHGYATAGWTAVPVTARIVERMAPLLGIRPQYDPQYDDAIQYWYEAHTTPRPRRRVHAASY